MGLSERGKFGIYMADESHLLILQRGVDTWNAWRLENPGIQPDLVGANLPGGQFPSYSRNDSAFVEKLYDDLLNAGVNTWLDLKQMVPGARILDTIIKAVGEQEKLILVCSSSSIESEWVEDELMQAFSSERETRLDVVIPIRIDDSILHSDEPWTHKLKNSRYIGDFSKWNDASFYAKSLRALLEALQRR